MKKFNKINKKLPNETQEVKVIINNNFENICKCMFYDEKNNLFPNGFFGTFYKMAINNVTHWKNA